MDEYKNILDILLDEENDELIEMYDEHDNCIFFEQVAIVPLDERIYTVLKPVDPEMMDIPEDEAIVFRIDFDESEEPYLVVETDEEVAIKVFDEYYRLLDECEE
ncbi:MAG: DUF1292 domain-containing protein [Clostridia bacterium]|nr:DUF1292 domain-containing protein [Clostridia bacterium]